MMRHIGRAQGPNARTWQMHNGRMTVRREVIRSAALSLLAIIGVSLAGFWAARAAATHEALHQAEQATELLATSVIAPALRDELLTGDGSAVAQLDTAVQRNVIGEQILTVRIWGPDGRILFSDDLGNLGSKFPLGTEEREVLATGRTHAELSDLAKEENAEQADFGQLLEVYTRVSTPSGQALLFETYQSTGGLATGTRRILLSFAPVILGGLLLFGTIQLALNWRLARNLASAQRDREGLLQQALDASQHERRNIAADLHDGVVQELVGLTFALEGMAADPTAASSQRLRGAATTTRHSVRGLRSLLVEIYPPNLEQIGLAGAIDDLAAAARGSGLDVSVELDPHIELSQPARDVAYRVVREALSNVRRHARAKHVLIRLAAGPGTDSGGSRAVLSVADDGVGFDPQQTQQGHLGLQLARDLADTIGASLTLTSQPGAGTTVRLELPQ